MSSFTQSHLMERPKNMKVKCTLSWRQTSEISFYRDKQMCSQCIQVSFEVMDGVPSNEELSSKLRRPSVAMQT